MDIVKEDIVQEQAEVLPCYIPLSNKNKNSNRTREYKSQQQDVMWSKYRATVWNYEKGRDPDSLVVFNSFGSHLYVVRYKGRENANRQKVFRNWLVNDPGLKTFKVYINVGNGDIYYMMPQISDNIRYYFWKISKLQSIIEEKVNELQETKDLNESVLNNLNLWLTDHKGKVDYLKLYQDAQVELEAFKQTERLRLPEYKEITLLYEKIHHNKDKLHQIAALFETSFDVLLDPDFKANEQLLKRKPNELAKTWKSTACGLAHAKCKKKVLRLMSRAGKCLATPSEACSTAYCTCGVFWSPGWSRFKNCPGCGKRKVRDECGISIVAFMWSRILAAIRKKKKEGSPTTNDNSSDRVEKDRISNQCNGVSPIAKLLSVSFNYICDFTPL
jgi:hypothetical protein